MKRALAVAAGLALFGAGAARADSVADFYKGKTITMLIGYGTGGGYDTYARLMAQNIGRHIPGHPNVIVQNMPGAGSLKATNYLYNVAPKDGTVIGAFARNMPLLGLMETEQKVQFDPMKFTWLGSSSSFANDAYLLLVRKDAKDKTVEDARRPGGPPILLGSTAQGTSSDLMPTLLRDKLGFHIKEISGYRDSGALFLAMERHEIEGRTVGLSAVRANKPDWLEKDGPMHVLVVFGRATRHPDFPDAPTARELAPTPKVRKLIQILELPYTLARPYAAPPGIPADRAKALQKAFMETHKDPAYRERAKTLGIDVSPISGDEVLDLIREIKTTPREEMQEVKKLMGG